MAIGERSFQFGAWHVEPGDNSISNADEVRQMEPRAMDVLVALCKEPGAILSSEQLLEQCWGSTLYGDNPVHKTIAQVRRVLGDKSATPEYIETIRKRGYRTLAPVQFNYSEAQQEGTWMKESPFRGLQAFDEKHAAIFFGRSDAIFHLIKIVEKQVNDIDACGLILILGPSGCGKTSFVRAGVFPSLLQKNKVLHLISQVSFDLAEKGEHTLLLCLASMLLDLEVNQQGIFKQYSANRLAELLLEDLDAVLAMLSTSMLSLPNLATRHALFIDRFEAVFDEKSVSNKERNEFLIILDKLARSHFLLVFVACRNDFYPAIANYPLLMEAKAQGAHFDLSPPTQAETAQMIRLPALAARLSFGIDEQSKVRLDDVLCASATGNPDVLPLLQYTLHELYRLRSSDGELSFSAFQQLGGIEGAIGQRAEQVLDGLTKEQRACLPQVLSLVATFSTDNAIVTSRRAAWSSLSSDEQRAVVNALVESRLFVSELVDGSPGFGVAHEALLRRWPRVVEWIAAHRQALQIRSRIGELALRWQQEGQAQDLLLPEGKQLEEARSLLGLSTFSLSQAERALIAASSLRAQWRKRLRTTTFSTIIVLALLALGLGASASSAKRQAQERRVEAEGLMSFMLGDFADKLRPIGRLDLLDSIGSKASEYFGRSGEDDLSHNGLTQRAKALQVLAEVRITRGDSKSAQEALVAANVILSKQLTQRPKDLDVLKNLADNMAWQGRIHYNKNEWPQTAEFYRRYLAYADQLHQLDPGNPEWWIVQCYAHNNVGVAAFRQRDLATAEKQFLLAVNIGDRALAKKPHDRTLRGEYVNSISWLGKLKTTEGKLLEAMQLFQKEGAIVQALHLESPNDAVWAGMWAKSLGTQASLHAALGRRQQALEAYQQAERLHKRNLLQEPNNGSWQRNLVHAQFGIQMNLPANIDPQIKLRAWQEISQITHKLVQRDAKQRNWMQWHFNVQIKIAKQLLVMGQHVESQAKLRELENGIEQYFSTNSKDQETKLVLVNYLLARAEVEQKLNNDQVRRNVCERGRDVLSNEMTESADYSVLDPWVRLHICLDAADKVQTSMQRLADIGYQEPEYLQKIFARNNTK